MMKQTWHLFVLWVLRKEPNTYQGCEDFESSRVMLKIGEDCQVKRDISESLKLWRQPWHLLESLKLQQRLRTVLRLSKLWKHMQHTLALHVAKYVVSCSEAVEVSRAAATYPGGWYCVERSTSICIAVMEDPKTAPTCNGLWALREQLQHALSLGVKDVFETCISVVRGVRSKVACSEMLEAAVGGTAIVGSWGDC